MAVIVKIWMLVLTLHAGAAGLRCHHCKHLEVRAEHEGLQKLFQNHSNPSCADPLPSTDAMTCSNSSYMCGYLSSKTQGYMPVLGAISFKIVARRCMLASGRVVLTGKEEGCVEDKDTVLQETRAELGDQGSFSQSVSDGVVCYCTEDLCKKKEGCEKGYVPLGSKCTRWWYILILVLGVVVGVILLCLLCCTKRGQAIMSACIFWD